MPLSACAVGVLVLGSASVKRTDFSVTSEPVSRSPSEVEAGFWRRSSLS
jgi:hypothetical protein